MTHCKNVEGVEENGRENYPHFYKRFRVSEQTSTVRTFNTQYSLAYNVSSSARKLLFTLFDWLTSFEHNVLLYTLSSLIWCIVYLILFHFTLTPVRFLFSFSFLSIFARHVCNIVINVCLHCNNKTKYNKTLSMWAHESEYMCKMQFFFS